jgi:hypothetical protein
VPVCHEWEQIGNSVAVILEPQQRLQLRSGADDTASISVGMAGVMTIRLPQDVERSSEAAVRSARFASGDDALTGLLLRKLAQDGQLARSESNRPVTTSDPILGLMRNDVELMDQIVADASRQRREETWREANL